MKDLVIVMAGDDSLHEAYVKDRDYELWVCYWGDDEDIARRYGGACDRMFRFKGQKWDLVRQVAADARRLKLPAFSAYRHVFLPDDDIRFAEGAKSIAGILAMGRCIGADLFQPAIANDFYSWEVTRVVEGLCCRAVTVVEVMMPVFSGVVFERCVLPLLHAHRHVAAGWGIERLVVRFAECELGRAPRVFILDALPAIHTRPAGQGSSSHEVGWDESFMTPLVAAMPVATIEAFADVEAAAAYRFPPTDRHLDLRCIDGHLQRVRIGRRLARLYRKRNLIGVLIRWVYRCCAGS